MECSAHRWNICKPKAVPVMKPSWRLRATSPNAQPLRRKEEAPLIMRYQERLSKSSKFQIGRKRQRPLRNKDRRRDQISRIETVTSTTNARANPEKWLTATRRRKAHALLATKNIIALCPHQNTSSEPPTQIGLSEFIKRIGQRLLCPH